MPYEIIREPRGVWKRFRGVVTPEEFFASVRDFHNDPRFETLLYSINDFTDAEQFVLSEAQVEYTAAVNIGSVMQNSTVRIIGISTNPQIIGLAAHYDRLTGRPILIFPTIAAARAWIAENFGVPAPAAEA